MRYRPEVDGLRAIAILPVLGYHLGLGWLPGGFTGVDVFFVISGYLISGLMLEEMGRGEFSVLRFYQRRALRLLPALVVVCLVTTGLALWQMLPNEFADQGRTLTATALFVANVFFQQNSDYFGGMAESAPLLHTWSLAVEEQFYLLFPLLLLGLHRFAPRRIVAVTLAGVALSLLLCVQLTERLPSTSFYLLPTRAWELGLGALVAMGLRRHPDAPARLGPLPGLIGLALILWGIARIGPEDDFPGANALFPAVGATLILAGAGGIGVARLLALAPFAWIGRISYSLYLVHWPLIVFWREVHGPDSAGATLALLAAASLALAWISWRWIEQPFRSAAWRQARPARVLWPAAAGLAALALLGTAIARTGEGWRDYPADVLAIAEYSDYQESAEYRESWPDDCMLAEGEGQQEDVAASCLDTQPGKADVLLFGDSHAAHIYAALSARHPDVNFLAATASGCRPLPGGEVADGKEDCGELRSYIYDRFLPRTHVDTVILAARWKAEELPLLAPAIARLRQMAGRVIVLGPVVEYQEALPVLAAKARLTGNDARVSHLTDPERWQLEAAMRPVVEAAGARYVSMLDILCPGRKCTFLTPGDVPISFDYGHFTLAGATWVVDRLKALNGPALALQTELPQLRPGSGG